MFNRCARGSCDFVSFSVDERVRIVEDIDLLQERVAPFRLKIGSLVESLKLWDSIMEVIIFECCGQEQFIRKPCFGGQEVRLDIYPRFASISTCQRFGPILRWNGQDTTDRNRHDAGQARDSTTLQES
jgi:hypothetical protein